MELQIPVTKVPMKDFMGRFAEQFFSRAKDTLNPEYLPGDPQHAPIRERLNRLSLLRPPFPAQAEVIYAGSTHLYKSGGKSLILSQDMGTGKTLVGSTISMMGDRPQRVICVVPPHLVGKWARELQITFPNIAVHKINHAGAIEVLEKAYKENPGAPQIPEFWIIGRVRLRMGFSHRVVTNLRTTPFSGRRRRHCCPSCGRPLLMKITDKEAAEDDAQNNMDIIASESASEEEGDIETARYAYVNGDWLDGKRRYCTEVQGGAPEYRVAPGCGSPLWEARRLSNKSPAEVLQAAIQRLPGIGKKTIGTLMEYESAVLRGIANALSNGEIHPALGALLNKGAVKKVQRYLDTTGFTVGDGNYAPVEYIKRYIHRGWFDVAIFDELHELKGDNTAQGVAFGILSGCARKTIGLTGTLVDGYAASLHPLLFRADPHSLLQLGFGANDGARFQREMGIIKEIVTEVEEDRLHSSRGRKKVYRQTRNLPGLHPTVVTNMLLPNALFLELPDIERSLQEEAQKKGFGSIRLLPSYRETFVRIQQTPDQETSVREFCDELLKEMKNAMRLGNKSLMGPVMSSALYAADGGFADVVCHPKYHEKPLGVLSALPTEDGLLEKERFMRDLVRREIAANRRVLIYTIYSDKLDLTERYRRILAEDGTDARVLKSSVPTETREEWVQDVIRDGCQVLICNPNLVKTGLDLFEFTTILFMQAGYSTDTVLQASRRSWRIGQTEPVRVYFASYAATPQMTATALMAKKIRVSTQAKGNISDTGMSAAIEHDDDDGSSMLMAIANDFLNTIRDRSHDAITGAISCLANDSTEGEFTANSMREIQDMLAGRPAKPDATVPTVCTPPKPAAVQRPQYAEEEDLLAMVFGIHQDAVKTPVKTVRRRVNVPKKPQFRELDLFA